MTPEEFEQVIADGDPMRVAQACESLDENQRRRLSKTAQDIDREVRRREDAWDRKIPDTPFWTRFIKRFDPARGIRINTDAIDVAILAVGPLSAARSPGPFGFRARGKASRKALTDRRPEWIDQLINEQLDADFRSVSWILVRGLVSSGACAKATSEGYIRLMVDELDGRSPVSQRLLDEPDLLEDVWRLFEVETYALVGHEFRDPFETGDGEGWGAGLIKLSQSGLLDRRRLLDSCLAALDNDFKNNTLTGYIRLFEKLAPTDGESAARQQKFFALLANRASHVVTFSLKMLKRIAKGKRLDGQAFIAAVPIVFALNAIGQSKTALAIMAQAVKGDATLVPWALGAAIEALTHEATDVQEKAIDLIESWSDRAHADHATTLRERLDDLAPSVRGRVQALIAKIAGEPAAPDAQAVHPDKSEPALDELLVEAEGIDPHWRSLAGFDAATEAIRGGRMPGPLDFDLLDVPLLSATEPVQPIETVDELIDVIAHAIEKVDSADELERILDGISRLADQRPDDFERRTEPLAKRLGDELEAYSAGQLFVVFGECSRALRLLWISWFADATLEVSDFRGRQPLGIGGFVVDRLDELIARVRNGQSAPLLAAPTHRHGWIDPRTLVERAAESDRRGLDIGPFDLLQALLRLAPDRRRAALNEAADLQGDVGRILRWALGGADGPSERDQDDAPLWLAAGRARAPRGRLDELAIFGFEEDNPDAVIPAKYSFEVPGGGYKSGDDAEIVIRSEPSFLIPSLTPLMVTPMLHRRPNSRGLRASVTGTEWGVQWTASIWPLCVESLLAQVINPLMARLDTGSSSTGPNHIVFDSLFEPDRPWSELAHLAVSVALLTKDPDARAAALDAMIEAIADGRVHPEPLAHVLMRLMAGGWVKLNRLAEALREVARVAPLHAWTAAGVLDTLASSFDKPPRDAHHVLTLFLELSTELGLAPTAQCRTTLESIKGSGKSAECAKALLALKSQPQAPAMNAARRQALTARIARAKRWQAAS